MKSRSLFLSIAAGLLVSGIGALDARATNVPLPTNIANLLAPPAGLTATVVGAETLTFSNFTYTSAAIPTSAVTVNSFTFANETGISFNGSFTAAAGTTIDMAITYVVTAPAGEMLNDAFLSAAGSGTGSYSIGETIDNGVTGAFIGTLTSTSTVPTAPILTFPGVQSLFITKDISVVGTGGNGFTLSVVQQGFSSNAIPEPSSLALLGIGMTGFLAFRRLFKRTSVA